MTTLRLTGECPPSGARSRSRANRRTPKISVEGKTIKLTNLEKPFWPELGITKRDLLQYYADVAWAVLPHICDRAMVMKRYPHGAHGEFFFQKHAPSPRPEWIPICNIEHSSTTSSTFR